MISSFKNYLRSNSHWYIFFVLSHLAIFIYYRLTWQSFPNFIESVDHGSKFMMDFTNHYYPMSRAFHYGTTANVEYFYPAFFALILSPLGALSLDSALAIWLIIQCICLVILYIVSVRGIVKLSLGEATIFALLYTTSFPLLHNLKWGQVSLLLTTIIATALLFSYQQKSIISGILLAFATAIKIYPVIFVIYLVAKRDRRAIIAFGVALIIFYFAFPSNVMGFPKWFEFETGTQSILNKLDWAEDVNSQYIANVGLRWFGLVPHTDNSTLIAKVFSIIGYLIATSCFAMVWLFRENSPEASLRLSMVSIFISIPFLVKTSWPHYFTYLPLCQIVLYYHFSSSLNSFNKLNKLFITLPIISMATSSIFMFNFFSNRHVYNEHGILFIANFILLIELYAVVFLQATGQYSIDQPSTVVLKPIKADDLL